MQVFFWLLLGLLAGGIVAISFKDTKKLVIFFDLLLGAVGAIVGGLLTNIFTWQHVAGVYDETILLVVLGAGFLIWIGRAVLVKNYR